MLAPDGEWIPPGGLGQFRLMACGPCQVEMLLSFICFVCCLSTDITLGSGDVVP